jgi:hypothetical protein
MKVTDLTSNFLITEDNLLSIVIYLANNLTNKVLSVDQEEVSSEESKLFSDQADMIIQILRSNKISNESVMQL